MRVRPLLAAISVAPLFGCASSVPTYQWQGEQAAITTLAHRAESIRSVRATATITLTSATNQHVTLDAAIVADNVPPTSAQGSTDKQQSDLPKSVPNSLRLRIRTWKFGQAIFDLTARPDGVWLAADSGSDDAAPDEGLESLKPEQIAQAWNLFFGDFFSRPGLRTATDPRTRSLLTSRVEEGVTTECRIDMDTLTAREYVIRDEHGVRQTLTLARYQELGDPPIPWPMLVIAQGDQGRVMVRFDEVEINPQLEDAVFTPPRRAVKQP